MLVSRGADLVARAPDLGSGAGSADAASRAGLAVDGGVHAVVEQAGRLLVVEDLLDPVGLGVEAAVGVAEAGRLAVDAAGVLHADSGAQNAVGGGRVLDAQLVAGRAGGVDNVGEAAASVAAGKHAAAANEDDVAAAAVAGLDVAGLGNVAGLLGEGEGKKKKKDELEEKECV